MALPAFLAVATSLAVHQPATPQLSTWVVPWDPKSTSTFVMNASKLSEGMLTYLVTDNSGLIQRSTEWNETTLQSVRAAAKLHKVKLFATVTNADSSGFDPVRMSLLLHLTSLSIKAVKTLTDVAEKDGFDGIDLDYESLSAKDRVAFSSFVRKLSMNLHAHHLLLSVTVHPKTSEPGNWDGPQAQDWKAIGQDADVVRPMCYDYSWSDSPVGPIAPTDWVAQVARFAISQIPPEKVNIGVAWYGYDWKVQPATSLTFFDLPKTPYTLDPVSQERRYGSTIYFAGPESFQAKQAALKALGPGTAVQATPVSGL